MREWTRTAAAALVLFLGGIACGIVLCFPVIVFFLAVGP